MFFILIDFAEISSKWPMCSNSGTQIDALNIDDAKTKCTGNPGCKIFVDVASQQEKFSYCNSEMKVMNSSISSTLYEKCKWIKLNWILKIF